MKTISVFSIKGGVGKSTTAYNLSVALRKFHKKRVLLIDIDPQGNSSAALGVNIFQLEAQLKDGLTRQKRLQQLIISTDSGVDVIASNLELARDELMLSGKAEREHLLRKAITRQKLDYDFLLIDCPPNAGLFSTNALLASEYVIVPVDASFLGLFGLAFIEDVLHLVAVELEHPVEILGILKTRFDGRSNHTKKVSEMIDQRYGEKVFHAIIPETVRVRDAVANGLSIFDYDSKHFAAKAYSLLAAEVVSRVK